MKLSGRVALVTGGGRGIGRAVALGLAEDGADVAVNYRRDEAAALETAAAIERLGRRARAFRASVDSWAEDQALVEQVLAEFGHVDILVNNAGLASRGQSVADTEPAELERVVRTHAFAPHFLAKLVLPSMRTQAVPTPTQRRPAVGPGAAGRRRLCRQPLSRHRADLRRPCRARCVRGRRGGCG